MNPLTILTEVTRLNHDVTDLSILNLAGRNRLDPSTVRIDVLSEREGLVCASTKLILNRLARNKNAAIRAIYCYAESDAVAVVIVHRINGKYDVHGHLLNEKEIVPRSLLQQLDRLPQPRGCLAMVPGRQTLVREVLGVVGLRLVAAVAKPIAISSNLRDAANKVAIRIAGLPVVRVVDADDRADMPVEMAAVSGLLHCSRIQLRQHQRLSWLGNVDQHVSMLAQWAQKVEADLVDFWLRLFEFKISFALLALDHGVLRLDRRIVA